MLPRCSEVLRYLVTSESPLAGRSPNSSSVGRLLDPFVGPGAPFVGARLSFRFERGETSLMVVLLGV